MVMFVVAASLSVCSGEEDRGKKGQMTRPDNEAGSCASPPAHLLVRGNAVVCNGPSGGVCQDIDRGSGVTYPSCECNEGYDGKSCMSDKDEGERNDERAKAEEGLKEREKFERDSAMCTGETSILCPALDKDISDPSKAGTCVAVFTTCFGSNATALAAFKSKKSSGCPQEDSYFCEKQGKCSPRGVPCAQHADCAAATPFRCRDWTCAADKAGCPAVSSSCEAGHIMCPDGLCYDAADSGNSDDDYHKSKECVRKGVHWDGCPSETIECIGKKGVCAISTEECTTRVGCAPPLKNCGVQRDPNTGKPVWATDGTAAKMICAASCPEGDSHDRKPKLHTSKVDGGKKDQRIEAMDSLNKIAMRLKTLKDGAFTVKDGSTVNFTVASVADSLVQEGSFGDYFASGALLSALLQIEPSAEITVIAGGLQLDIPVLDPTALGNATICTLLLANMQVMAVSDVTDITETPNLVGQCTKGELGTCSCAVEVTHFSTFGVVDTAMAYEAPGATTNKTVTAAETFTSPAAKLSPVCGVMAYVSLAVVLFAL
eukprot:CAMPEP_0179439130 /NCGR_PEP_ID=MMETSP0799-20121207/22774_1 /TAXON_ID=46947 /ORGANISM="Geminigera cryophila, Strain CCMP2564" /LENGTH=543 /DNA_ID=CAMNT_0021221261 /DNA_START=61 /DNA_END=1695 /DNA_ORIENTATION=-